jgi:hypothetical protein
MENTQILQDANNEDGLDINAKKFSRPVCLCCIRTKRKKFHEVGENCIMNSLIICVSRIIKSMR